MRFAIRRYHSMPSLWTSVVAHDGMGRELSGEKIGDSAFASIAKTQIGDQNRLLFLMHIHLSTDESVGKGLAPVHMRPLVATCSVRVCHHLSDRGQPCPYVI